MNKLADALLGGMNFNLAMNKMGWRAGKRMGLYLMCSKSNEIEYRVLLDQSINHSANSPGIQLSYVSQLLLRFHFGIHKIDCGNVNTISSDTFGKTSTTTFRKEYNS